MSSLLLTPDFVSNDRTTLVFPLQYSQLNNQDTYDLLDLFGITLSSDMINKVFSTPKVVSAQNQHYKMMPLAIPSKELIWFSVPLLPVLQAIGKQKKIY